MTNQDNSSEEIGELLGMSGAIGGMLENVLDDEEFKRLALEYKKILEEAKEEGEEPDQDRLEEIGKRMDQRMRELS